MIYVSKEESIIKIEGTKDECMSDLYNTFKGYMRSGVTPTEIVKIVIDAARAVEWESDEHDSGE